MSYQYKGYNPANAKHVKKYNDSHYKIVSVAFDRASFEDEIKPFAESSGMTIAELVRQAVTDYIATHKD
jgi:hypothetical protein